MLVLMLAPGVSEGQAALAGRLERVSASVFALVDPPAGANSAVVVTDREVVIVDAQVTPGLAGLLIRQVREVTDLPVRYVVNTHWHVDHSHGNWAFRNAFPDVEIIAHLTTGDMMSREGAAQLALWPEFLRSQIVPPAADSEAVGVDRGNSPDLMESIIAEVSTYHLEPPSLAVSTRLALYRSGLTVEIIHPGAGHTRGDLVVLIPEERVLISGDLLLGFTEHPLEYATTLRNVLDLQFETVVPGHGPVDHNPRPGIRGMIDEIETLVSTVLDLRADGVSARDAVAQVSGLGLPGLIQRRDHVVETIYSQLEDLDAQ